MRMSRYNFILALVLFLVAFPVFGQTSDLLSPEEELWLKSLNNTIVVYPEKNNPPFSYTSASGNIQGLAIDFIELIAEKIDAKVVYLLPQSRSQVLNDFKQGKGDVVIGVMDTESRGAELIFSDSFVTVPTVIVVRKDFEKRKALTLNDFNGKRVSMVDDSALEEYVKKNYPRVVIEDVTDDEVSLQQVILGEVDAAVMDIASLSFYLSKQVLSSVKVVGNTGLDYKPAMALLPENTILQSILEKGMTQISTTDRSVLNDKWIITPGETETDDTVLDIFQGNADIVVPYALLVLVLIIVGVKLAANHYANTPHLNKIDTMVELKREVSDLESTNDILATEMRLIKEKEDKLQDKIDLLSK